MMKRFFALVLLAVVPIVVLAQSNVKVSHKAKVLSKSQIEAETLANQMASGIRAAEAALTPAELAIAERIYQGRFPCELGAFVTLTADARTPGYFDVQIKNIKYRMFPVITRTGAVRLEDQQAGAVWLQLPNKSMLMDHKLGQRLADECMSPEQAKAAQMLISHPAPSLL